MADIGFGFDDYDNLKGAAIWNTEKAISRMLGVDPSLLEYVDRRPSEFGFEDSNPYGDALRHLLLAGELQRMHPSVARPLLWGHEHISGRLYGQPERFRNMDLENNEIGLFLGNRAKSREALENQALLMLPHANIGWNRRQ